MARHVFLLFGYQLLIYWKNISINIVLWWIAEVAFFRQSLFPCVSFLYKKMIIIVIITVISIKTTTCWAGRRKLSWHFFCSFSRKFSSVAELFIYIHICIVFTEVIYGNINEFFIWRKKDLRQVGKLLELGR